MIEQAKQLISRVFKEENVEFVDIYGDYRVLIRLEPFIIRNDIGQEHKITGLWLTFFMKVSDSDKVQIHYLMSRRSIQTIIEYQCNYCHSHLPKSNLTEDWQTFCAGDGEFAMRYEIVRAVGLEIDALETFFMLLIYYLSYEDLSNPHTRLENVLPLTTIPSRHFNTSHTDRMLASERLSELEFNSNYELLDSRKNHDILTSVFPGEKVLKVNGQYAVINTNYKAEYNNYTPQELFQFKGEPVIGQITYDIEDVRFSESSEHYIHPELLKYLSNEFKHRITTKLIKEQNRQRIEAREAYYNSIRELSEPEQIFVFKNI